MLLLLLFWLKVYALIYARTRPFFSMLTITLNCLQSFHLIQTHYGPDAGGSVQLRKRTLTACLGARHFTCVTWFTAPRTLTGR